jgi:predicted  nucleic acid-binding Zn-ribbon protein
VVEQARADREASVGLQQAEHKALAVVREEVLRARGELVEAEGRARRAVDGASAEEHKVRLLKSLGADQSRLLQAELDGLKAEVGSKHERLVGLEEQCRVVEEDIEKRRREFDSQCRQLRKDGEAEREGVKRAQSEARAMQGEIEQLTGRYRSAMDELGRVEEGLKAAQRRGEGELRDRTERLHHAARDLQDMEDALGQWREERASAEELVAAAKGQLEQVQREVREAQGLAAERQKAASEELKQVRRAKSYPIIISPTATSYPIVISYPTLFYPTPFLICFLTFSPAVPFLIPTPHHRHNTACNPPPQRCESSPSNRTSVGQTWKPAEQSSDRRRADGKKPSPPRSERRPQPRLGETRPPSSDGMWSARSTSWPGVRRRLRGWPPVKVG